MLRNPHRKETVRLDNKITNIYVLSAGKGADYGGASDEELNKFKEDVEANKNRLDVLDILEKELKEKLSEIETTIEEIKKKEELVKYDETLENESLKTTWPKCAESISFPEGITTIEEIWPKKLIIPEGVTCIKQIRGADFEEIVLPKSLKSLVYGFINCKALKRLVIPGNVESLTATFKGLSTLEEFIIEEGPKKIALTCQLEGTTYLKKIVLPKRIIRIGSNVFSGNTVYNLKEIKFLGSKKEWDAIPKANDWFKMTLGSKKTVDSILKFAE